MAVCETHLDKSGFYHTALETLMDSLRLNATPILEPTRCNSSFRKHFASADEDKFFSFCSTVKSDTKSDSVIKESIYNITESSVASEEIELFVTCSKDTPKRAVSATRKQKLFETSEGEEFKPKTRWSVNTQKLSPQSLLLKKAITRMECLQRRQERIALSKKPLRTSLRI